jgi:hypothetical protein
LGTLWNAFHDEPGDATRLISALCQSFDAALPPGEGIIIEDAQVLRCQDAVLQAGDGDDEAVERIAGLGDFHGPAEGGIEILIADREADPVRQIGHDLAGIDCDPMDFIQKLQLKSNNR